MACHTARDGCHHANSGTSRYALDQLPLRLLGLPLFSDFAKRQRLGRSETKMLMNYFLEQDGRSLELLLVSVSRDDW